MKQSVSERIRDDTNTLGLMLLGSIIYALSVDIFYSPAKLLAGGVTGFSQLLNYSIGTSTSLMIVLINIPLFILAWFFVDRRFTVFSLIGMLLLSGMLSLFSGLSIPFSSNLTAVILGGALNGLGLGLIYRSEASAGGTDIISKIIQRYFSGNMAYTGLIINMIVVGASAVIYGLDQAVLTICTMYISSQVNSYIIDGIDHRRAVSIITQKPDEVAAAIHAAVGRGCTVLHGYGAYSQEEHDMLYCVISKRQLAKVKRTVKVTDPDAFFTITMVTGVYGHGHDFRSIRHDIQ